MNENEGFGKDIDQVGGVGPRVRKRRTGLETPRPVEKLLIKKSEDTRTNASEQTVQEVSIKLETWKATLFTCKKAIEKSRSKKDQIRSNKNAKSIGEKKYEEIIEFLDQFLFEESLQKTLQNLLNDYDDMIQNATYTLSRQKT